MKFKRILIGIDDSKQSLHAAEYGFDLAHKYKAAVGLVHIVEPVITPQTNDPSMLGAFMPSFGAENLEVEHIQEDHSKKLLANTASSMGGDLEVTQFSEIGPTADGIINCAVQFKADLIVLGTHQRSGFDRLMMGNIAEDVLRHSAIPVLVIPTEEREA